MKLLITGGTGYIGGAIVSAAVARGHEVVVFARSARSSGLPGTLIDGDIRDAPAVSAAARGCDGISHSAALVTIWRRRRDEFDDVNVGGLRNVLAAARQAGIARVVYTSSFLALPPSDSGATGAWNDYQRTKLAAEIEAAREVEKGAPLIRMYPGVVYGPGRLTEGNLVGRLIVDHLAGKLPGVIGPDKIWSFAYINDVANAHLEAVERGEPGARFHLGGENAPQMRVFELLRDFVGKKLPWTIPLTAARILATVEEGRARFLGAMPLLTRGTLEIFCHDWALDCSAAADKLGYRVTPLADGIRQTLAGLDALPS
jgi:farnesol dehydrogenase